MSTAPSSVTVLPQKPTTEEKILTAAQESTTIIGIFSPGIAQAVSLGVAVEPLVSGFGKMIIGHFLHHTKEDKKN